jgi:hypothetical protein
MVWILNKKQNEKNNLARLGLEGYMSYGYSNSYMSKKYLK